jgi:hypothetical protein
MLAPLQWFQMRSNVYLLLYVSLFACPPMYVEIDFPSSGQRLRQQQICHYLIMPSHLLLGEGSRNDFGIVRRLNVAFVILVTQGDGDK